MFLRARQYSGLALLAMFSAPATCAADDDLALRVDLRDLQTLQEEQLDALAPLQLAVSSAEASVQAAVQGEVEAHQRLQEAKEAVKTASDKRQARLAMKLRERTVLTRTATLVHARAALRVAQAELELARLEQLKAHADVSAYAHGDFLLQVETARWEAQEAAAATRKAVALEQQAQARLTEP